MFDREADQIRRELEDKDPALAADAKGFHKGYQDGYQEGLKASWKKADQTPDGFTNKEQDLVSALVLIASQHSGNPASTSRSDCMAVMAKTVLAKHGYLQLQGGV